jgi:hypothetical protein
LRLREVLARNEHLAVRCENLGLRVEVAAAARDAVRDEAEEHARHRTDDERREEQAPVDRVREEGQEQTDEQTEPGAAQRTFEGGAVPRQLVTR